ncbi:MAG: DUF2062 domain-containing protein [Gaiellales bacterium]
MNLRALRLPERVRTLMSLDDPPWRIALALAVGVFISFTPFWGLQTILALVVATVARLNRAVTVTGTWLNLPWFAPFVYAGALKLGALILPDLRGITGMSLALLLGTTLFGIGAAVLTYLIAFPVLRTRRARRAARDQGDETTPHAA